MKIGFIGAGNMAGAIMRGILAAKAVAAGDISASDISPQKLDELRRLGVYATASNLEVIARSDCVAIAVKPNVYDVVLNEIKNAVKGKLIISIGAGVSIDRVRSVLGGDAKIVRAMPNIAALAGEAMTVLCGFEGISEEDFGFVKNLFDAVGKTVALPEKLIAAATAANGGGPAYVAMMIEAMADAAVLLGVPREESRLIAAQTVYGSAKLALDFLDAPSKIKDMVCSPGGTTIEAVHQLERDGFRAALMNAMERAADKAQKML